MNINSLITKDYRKNDDFAVRINKPNFQKAQMNVNSLITKDYRKKDDFVVRINKPNSNPISVKPKMSANVFATKDYENETAFRPQKNKPKQSQFLPKSALLQLVKLFLCYSLINSTVQSCHLEYKKLFYSSCRVLLGQEININVYNIQR